MRSGCPFLANFQQQLDDLQADIDAIRVRGPWLVVSSYDKASPAAQQFDRHLILIRSP